MDKLNEMYLEQSHKVIAVDYDGTITLEQEFGKKADLNPEAKKYLDLLNEKGFKIVLWTARLYDNYKGVLERCHKEFNMPYILEDSPNLLHGASGKLVAAYYIDDKSNFEKINWDRTYSSILEKYLKYID